MNNRLDEGDTYSISYKNSITLGLKKSSSNFYKLSGQIYIEAKNQKELEVELARLFKQFASDIQNEWEA